MSDIDAAKYNTVTFDCYGTLIDWEKGILEFLQPLLEGYDVHVIDEFVLEAYSDLEPLAQDEGGSYKQVLAKVLQRLGSRLAFTPSDEQLTAFSRSIEAWQPFPDTIAALQQLSEHFELAILSNIDNDLLAYSTKHLQVPFAHTITAEQVGVYKPDAKMFEEAGRRVEGPVLHVAQSRFHDIVPATALGLETVWINRPCAGAAKTVDANPTWTFDSLQNFVDAVRFGR